MFRNYMWNATNHNPFLSGLAAGNEVRNSIVYILKIFFFDQILVGILCLMLSFEYCKVFY